MEKHPVLFAGLALVIGAALSSSAGWLAADRTSDSSLDALKLQIQAQQQTREAQLEANRIDRDRQRLARVYSGFLDSVSDYRYETEAFRRCLREIAASEAGSRACIDDSSDWIVSGGRVQSKVNDVFIFGSPAAVGALEEMLVLLPETSGGVDTDEFLSTLPPVDGDAFAVAYVDFLDVMCRELRFASRPETSCE